MLAISAATDAGSAGPRACQRPGRSSGARRAKATGSVGAGRRVKLAAVAGSLAAAVFASSSAWARLRTKPAKAESEWAADSVGSGADSSGDARTGAAGNAAAAGAGVRVFLLG